MGHRLDGTPSRGRAILRPSVIGHRKQKMQSIPFRRGTREKESVLLGTTLLCKRLGGNEEDEGELEERATRVSTKRTVYKGKS